MSSLIVTFYITKTENRRVLVLKGMSSETTYVCVLTWQISSSSIILTSFRQEGGGGGASNFIPPTLKQTPKKPTQIRVKLKRFSQHG